MEEKKIFVISGPTASGKTFFAIELAKKFNAIVLNADSMQIYNGLPILSAQPNMEEQGECEHRLYNMLNIVDSNSVFKWLGMIKKESENIFRSGKNIAIVGGTGMYISRLINGIIELPETNEDLRNELNNLYDTVGWEKFYEIVSNVDPESIARLKKNDRQRLIRVYEIYKLTQQKLSILEKQENKKLFNDKNIFHINIFPERGGLYERCELRFRMMLKGDIVIDEVKNFIEKNREYIISNNNFPIYNTIGFREIKSYLEGKISREEMFYSAVKNTRNYAKRQFTWFRNQFKNVDFLINVIPTNENSKILLEEINNKVLKL